MEAAKAASTLVSLKTLIISSGFPQPPDATTGIETVSAGENPYLFQIQRSVITTMTINHDPDGVVGFHSDGVPVHTSLALTFQELEYVINEKDPISAAHSAKMKSHTDRAKSAQAASQDPTTGGNP